MGSLPAKKGIFHLFCDSSLQIINYFIRRVMETAISGNGDHLVGSKRTHHDKQEDKSTG